MQITAIKTRLVNPPQDDISDILETVALELTEGSFLAISSKIVAIWEGRCVPLSEDKDKLIKGEAEKFIPRELVPGAWVMHTIKNNAIVASAGIDESNSNNFYTLWPQNPQQSARKIWQILREKTGISHLGVIITDSRTMPMRWGVVGLCIGFAGFRPLINYIGTKDLFCREVKMESINIPDGLTEAAAFVMGEGAEQTPIAVIKEIPHKIEFIETDYDPQKLWDEFVIDPAIDIYGPIIYSAPWEKGGK